MEPRPITILGSTGSIGTSTLRVVSKYPDRFRIVALAAGDNIDVLADQVRTYRPKLVATKTEKGAEQLKKSTNTPGIEYVWGNEGAEAVASHTESEVVVSAIVGAAGLRPTLAAVRTGKIVALANKESMVVAGALVRRLSFEHHSKILPVDSEHNAIFQALNGANPESVRRLLLTASGGPFYLNPELDLTRVTKKEALAHPNWNMGPKITIDSATMMNKGLEIIEARWLFGFEEGQIDVIVHPQSVIHSIVEYVDGSMIAQLGVPDMCGPIAYALTYPERLDGVMKPLNLSEIRELTFFEPDHGRFPAIELARKALNEGETHPAVLNGANEVTVKAFLDEKISFTDIPRMNEEVLSSYRETGHKTLEDFITADSWGRQKAKELIGS